MAFYNLGNFLSTWANPISALFFLAGFFASLRPSAKQGFLRHTTAEKLAFTGYLVGAATFAFQALPLMVLACLLWGTGYLFIHKSQH